MHYNNTKKTKKMITKEQITAFIKKMENDGYILEKTFGFIPGVDFPFNDLISSDTLSKFWYKKDTNNEETKTFTPWLASFIESNVKLTLDIIVTLPNTEQDAL
jgi:hypothetical protein